MLKISFTVAQAAFIQNLSVWLCNLSIPAAVFFWMEYICILPLTAAFLSFI